MVVNAEHIHTAYAVQPNKGLKTKDGEMKTPLGHVIDFTKTAYGAFRSLQLVEKTLKVASEILSRIGHVYAEVTKTMAKNVAKGWGFLAIPRLPEVFSEAKNAIVGWRDAPKGNVSVIRNIADKFGTIAEAFATGCYAFCSMFASEKVLNAANVFDLTKNFMDITVHGEDLFKLGGLCDVKGVDAQVHNRLVDSYRHKMMLVVKTVISIASGVLGLLALAMGVALVPAVALLAMGVTGTVLAIWSHFYKETRNHELVDFTKIKITA